MLAASAVTLQGVAEAVPLQIPVLAKLTPQPETQAGAVVHVVAVLVLEHMDPHGRGIPATRIGPLTVGERRRGGHQGHGNQCALGRDVHAVPLSRSRRQS
ncbi:hypothetical protein HML84_21705 [Alcanivorax sp. IO_7]|nr:hypothetical protein HML84_21705 [Alcanivorax sp. IO_7]